MHAENVDRLDLETGLLEAVNDPVECARGIGSREHVFVHEQSPDEILVLPGGTEASHLEHEDTIVIEEVVNLAQERVVVTNSNVLRAAISFPVSAQTCGARSDAHLGHLEGNDLGEFLVSADLAVVLAQNAGTLRSNAIVCNALVSKLGLILAEGDTSDIAAKVFGRVSSKGSPSAANVEQSVLRLEFELVADESELVVLELFEGFLAVDIVDHASSINHARSQEPEFRREHEIEHATDHASSPLVKVIASVVVVTNLLLILGRRVPDDVGNQNSDDILEQRPSHLKSSPIVPVLEKVEHVAC